MVINMFWYIDNLWEAIASAFAKEENKMTCKNPKFLGEPSKFYDGIRKFKLFGPTFNTSEFEGCEALLSACGSAGWPVSWTAYALATAYHETAGTMQPIKEYGGYEYYTKLYDISGRNPSRAKQMGNTAVGDGARYCGRGYVQLTWKNNYKKASEKLGVDFVSKPELAMIPKHASDIMIHGMSEGWFTGKKLSNYLHPDKLGTVESFRKARYIINGQDKATVIAYYAIEFQKALQQGNWA